MVLQTVPSELPVLVWQLYGPTSSRSIYPSVYLQLSIVNEVSFCQMELSQRHTTKRSLRSFRSIKILTTGTTVHCMEFSQHHVNARLLKSRVTDCFVLILIKLGDHHKLITREKAQEEK